MFRVVKVMLFSLILAILGGCGGNQPADNPLHATPIDISQIPTEIPITATSVTTSFRKIITKEINESSKDPDYTINITYPYLTEPDDTVAAAFNEKVNAFLENEQINFKETASSVSDLDPSIQFPSSLSISFTKDIHTNDIISILFELQAFTSGAAHPQTFFKSMNFDIRSKSELSLADLFIDNSKYMDRIAEYCIKQLKSENVLDFEDGAQASEANYKLWNITKDGLRITFEPYQVAPYASGPQQVLVPYSEIKDILAPDSPINGFMQR